MNIAPYNEPTMTNLLIDRACPDGPYFIKAQVKRLPALARALLPPMAEPDLRIVLRALTAAALPRVEDMPFDELPFRISRHIRVRRVAEQVRDYEPFEAFLLLACAELYLSLSVFDDDLPLSAFFPLMEVDQI
jgi:hypothetical protein